MIALPTTFIFYQRSSVLHHSTCNKFMHETQPAALHCDIIHYPLTFLLSSIAAEQNKFTQGTQ